MDKMDLLDNAEYKDKLDATKRKRGLLQGLGILGDAFANVKTGAHYRLGQEPSKFNLSGKMSALVDQIKDPESPLEKQKKLYEAAKMQSGMGDLSRQSVLNSPENLAKIKSAYDGMGIPMPDGMSAAELTKNYFELARDKQKEKLRADQIKDDRAFDIKLADRKFSLDKQMLAAKEAAKPLGDKLTPGQKKVDEEFAKEYTDFALKGSYGDALKNVNQIRSAADRIGEMSTATGPIAGRMPLQSLWNADAVDVKEQVEEVVQRNLRAVLGAQFTEKEGERLIQRAYNPKLDEEVNKGRLINLAKAMETAIKSKKGAMDHYEKFGTLSNYKMPNFTLQDFEDAIDGKKELSLINSAHADSKQSQIVKALGKVQVTNGKESFAIDKSQLESAKKDGFYPVGE